MDNGDNMQSTEDVRATDRLEEVVTDYYGPQRVALLLKQLAQGLALVEGRREVTMNDILVLRHVAFSTIPAERRKILRLFVDGEEPTLTTPIVQKQLDMSVPTARKYMRQLAATGIGDWMKGVGNEPSTITLAKGWEWLRFPRAKGAPQTDEEREKVLMA